MAYDLIGDVHGCREELIRLLARLGYDPDEPSGVVSPRGRTAVFLGDLVNRGPDSPGVLRLVMRMTEASSALAVAGNHDVTFARALRGVPVEKPEMLKESLLQIEAEPEAFKREAIAFIDALPRRLVLDEGRLIVAHAGLPAEYHSEAISAEADEFAVFGRKVPDAEGNLVRYRWANDYRGEATVIYGHYSGLRAEWLNGTICIDTGCVYGGTLTALRYPERELVSVAADRIHYESSRSDEFRAMAVELSEA